MNTLYFGNAGVFDPRAMLTFGVSAKENENAIGYFGTGFKYAIAIVLRLGGRIEVMSGGERFVFTKKPQEIRGQSFDLVQMNGGDAGFTTRLGINWEPWMAFRELWCNCMDERGEVSTAPLTADTVIRVDCDEIYRAFVNKEMYVITGAADVETGDADIYNRPASYIFYRGVAITRAAKCSLLTYNVKTPIELTEDRTAKHDYQPRFAVQRALQSLSDERMLRRVLTADRESYEGLIGFDKIWQTSDQFVSLTRELLSAGEAVHESARMILRDKEEKAGDWPEVYLTRVQLSMLERAKAFLKTIGVDVAAYPIKIVQGLGDGVMGRALHKRIYLSLLPFNMGTKQVASTLLEEWVHNQHGVEDFDRRMQNWLFDKVVSLGEELKGEPV